jgi:hypothetical protein
MFGSKREEIGGGWRRLNDEGLQNVYFPQNTIRTINSRRIRWIRHIACREEKRNEYRVLVAKPEEIRPLGRPRRRWKDNIKMDIREIGWSRID